MVWSGNGGTQPGAGNGVCGTGTLNNTLGGAGYTNSFVYTHLGQIWQAPLNGGSQQYQYLYCDSTHPHQLTGVYQPGTNCATKSTSNQVYTSSDDAWGNVTSRWAFGSASTMSYNNLDQMTQWTSSSNTESYVYDASGQRVLRRSTNNTTTQIYTYPFGMSDFTYNSAGAKTSSTYYYSLGGTLIGTLSGGVTDFLMIDGLGSPLASISSTAGSAAVLGNQGYGPYGTRRYQQGTLGTSKGFTGQYADDLSGLDYYVSRYYDPIVGRFLSADTAQGNMQGMDPYGYVNGNPETKNDPTGRYIVDSNGTGYRQNHNNPPYRRWVPFTADDQGSPQSPPSITTCTPGTYGCYGPPSPLPTQGQITKWCNSNSGCSAKLAKNHSFSIQLSVNVVFLPPMFPGDPATFEQAVAEYGSIAEYNTYLLALANDPTLPLSNDIRTAILNALQSGDAPLQVEGQAGVVAALETDVTRFKQPYDLAGNPVDTETGSGGENDVETPLGNIEAKSGENVRLNDIAAQYRNTITNPTGKPFILYAPQWGNAQVQVVTNHLLSIGGPAFYITRTPDQLLRTLEYLNAGSPRIP